MHINRITLPDHLPDTGPAERTEGGGDMVVPMEASYQSRCKINDFLQSVQAAVVSSIQD